MKPKISEFSYGYALTEELVTYFKHSNIKSAPVFPSLYEEGRQGGGYDMKLEFETFPLFIQFKLSEYITAIARSKEVKASIYKKGKRFYRMKIWAKKYSKQHDLLLSLQQKNPYVYYAAPMFYKSEELNRYYMSHEIIKNSAFLTPCTIGFIDDEEEHSVCFSGIGDKVYRFSSPEDLGVLEEFDLSASLSLDSGEADAQRILSVNYDSWQMIERAMTDILLEYGIVKGEEADFMQYTISDRDNFQKVTYLARVYFGCQVIAVEKT
ncbi:MAG: hypothetical protein WBF90_38200 [Rivularia sp. (in: cyanobacteria)]